MICAALDLGLDLNVWPWVWLSVAALFALVELTLLAGSFVLLPFAISAFLASLAGFYDVAVEIQWLIFTVGGGLLFWVFWHYAKRFVDRHQTPLGVGADRLIGMPAIVTSTIDPDDTQRRGRIVVAGEEWGALAAGPAPIVEGAKVRITKMNGTRVVVEPLAAGDAPAGDYGAIG